MNISLLAKLSMRAVGLVCVVWALSACGGAKTPQETAAAFWEAVIGQDSAEAVAHSTLRDSQQYKSFSRDWSGFEPSWGRAVIDGNEASIGTTLTRRDRPNERPVELVTYLVRQDERWKVDYARTDEELNGPLAGLFGRLDRLGKTISEQLKLSSDEFEVEIERMSEQLEQLSDSLGRRAADSIQRYGEAMRRSIDEFVESIDRAIREERLGERDRRVLTEVSADLDRQRASLAHPTVGSVTDSGRSIAAARQRLGAIDDEAVEPYRQQWRDGGERIEAAMREMIDELTAAKSGRQD